MNDLKIGNKVPNFKLYNQDGELINMSDYIGVKALVLYFYPKNFTPGCTAQACSFRDQYQVFSDLGATVFGISNDSIKSHLRFNKKHKLPFDTLADEKGKVRNLYGVQPDLFGLIPGRETFIIDTSGKLILRFHSIRATTHIPKAIKILKTL